MNKYFILLNWLLAAVVVLVWHFLVPYFGYGVLAGSMFGGLITGGLISWQFHRDGDPDKEKNWRSIYFGKDYGTECMTMGIITFTLLASSLLFWRPFWSFFGGMFLMLWANIAVEGFWYIFAVRRK